MKQDKTTKPTTIIDKKFEIGSYEALWLQPRASFINISKRLTNMDGEYLLPSALLNAPPTATETYTQIVQLLEKFGITDYFGASIRSEKDYPPQLEDMKHKLALLYFLGDWSLVHQPNIAVIGARNPSDKGKQITRELVMWLTQKNYTITSGLAAGIDTVAHTSALDCGGKTIAVLGTPLSMIHPKSNSELFKEIMEKFLIISQVPFLKFFNSGYPANKSFFLQRNITMSAISNATIIVEAGEKSGTHEQARAALSQGRKLFILEHCFENNMQWPHHFMNLSKNVIKVKTFEDISNNL